MAKLIKHKGKRQKRVSPKQVSELLKAERCAAASKTNKAPMTLASIREFVRNAIRSTGGRPSLKGLEKVRRKVSLFEGDIILLEKLAERLSNEYHKITPLQLVAALVHKELETLEV